MNGTHTARHARPAQPGVTPPAPAAAPPAPPSHNANHTHATANNRQTNGATTNGTHPPAQRGKKKAAEQPVDPSQMYETLKNRIAALEEVEVHEEEEERRFAEEAQNSVSGMDENGIHSKYLGLFADYKRMERDHAKEKQKLVKDKDAAKSQLTKANQAKTKMENLARELQKDNKKLREDSKHLAGLVEQAQAEVKKMKSDMAKRAERAKVQETKYRETPNIVVRVHCKYRAELYFKISRKTKLAQLFSAWTERMEFGTVKGAKATGAPTLPSNGAALSTSANGSNGAVGKTTMQFIFTHAGHSLEADQTPEEAGIEDGDVILAVEIMDLTEGPGTEEVDAPEPRRQKLKKEWVEDPVEAKRTMEDIFDGVVRERLKEVLRQYELRERHFECVIRSKELEVLLSRARAAEQKQLAEGQVSRVEKLEEQVKQLRKELEDIADQRSTLADKLRAYCHEPNAARMQQLFASLQEELEAYRKPILNGTTDRPPDGEAI